MGTKPTGKKKVAKKKPPKNSANKAPPRRTAEEKPRLVSTISTAKRKSAFLEAFKKTGNITYSARIAGIDRTTHHNLWMKKEKYKREFDSAKEEAADLLEGEVLRRGVQGVDEPVFYKGAVVGQVRKYSDVLLIFLLKAKRPEQFRDRMEVSDPSGRNPLTAALEDMWTKLNGGSGGNNKPAQHALQRALPADVTDVQELKPTDGKLKKA